MLPLKLTFLWLNHIFAMSQAFWISRLFWLFWKHHRSLNSALSEKDAAAAMTQKGKKNVKVVFALVFDSLKIQSCRLTCSFPDNLNYADFSQKALFYSESGNCSWLRSCQWTNDENSQKRATFNFSDNLNYAALTLKWFAW